MHFTAVARRQWLSAPALLALGMVCAAVAACDPGTAAPPYAPEAALGTFALEEGFRIELVAAEPLVADPVAMDIDEHGRIFVAEMPGYPLDVSGSGRVKLLRDTDGDGRPDDAVVFAAGLRLPTGLMRWRDGVLVTDPPDVLYLADTTGDGRADLKRVVLTGFALSNAQHNANKPVYGLDNWIYIANNGTISWTEKFADPFGDRGSAIRFPDRPDAPRLPRNGADRNVRFQPNAYVLESLSTRSQFGQTFDAWGRHFLVNNSRHHMHEVIPARYFGAGDPGAIRTARHSTSDHGDAAAVYPITERPEHHLLTDRGVFTSACGLTYYLGGLFPAPYDEVTFVAEPVHNLVHVDHVRPEGPTFVASRLHEGREFLASSDSWFRPVNFSIGPDGALYLVDYYRQIVEHPEWMDDSLATHGNLTRGTARGRLYRIVPEGAGPMDWHDALDTGDTEALVGHLASPNAWWRMTAQRLLVDRKDPRAPALLEALAEFGSRPLARLHALWTLEGLNALTPASIRTALADEHPGIRENAVRWAVRHPVLHAALPPLAHDPDARVRFAALGAMGSVDGRQARAAQYRILWRDLENEWTQSLALVAMKASPQELMRQAARQPALPEGPRSHFLSRIATFVGSQGTPEAIAQVLTLHAGEIPVLQGIAQGLGRRGLAPVIPDSVKALVAARVLHHPAAEAALAVLARTGLPAVSDVPGLAADIVRDATAPVATRSSAARLLGLAGTHPALLAELVTSEDSLAVRRSALQALAHAPGEEPARIILKAWPTFTPGLRAEALAAFDSQPRAALLVEAMEQGSVLPAEIPWRYRVRLMRDTAEPVRSRARALLQLGTPAADARRAPGQPGDAMRGRDVFLALCASCHRAGETGSGMLGPDLATVRHWPRQALLNKIADPNGSIASGYEQWAVVRKDGTRLQGIVASETPAAITVATQQAWITVRRTDIEQMAAIAESAMPAGLHLGLDDEGLADLLAFISGH